MTAAEGLVLGIVQGLTEFLPVSSSGHLVLAQNVLHVRVPGLTVEILLHLGTLLAVIIAFYREIHRLIIDGFAGMLACKRVGCREVYRSNNGFRLLCLIVVGTVPAALAGFFLSGTIENIFTDTAVVAVMLMVPGFLVFSTRLVSRPYRANGMLTSFLIGCAQALALIPGISRSGATISCALHSGLSPEEAVRFSFLLALPAIAGATILKVGEITSGGIRVPVMPMVVGMAAAFLSGYLAIKLLIKLLVRGRFSVFAYYCWFVGATALMMKFILE